jgi:Tol biopolymer transport system component
MLIVRVFTAAARPVLAGGALLAAATGVWFAYDNYRGAHVTPFQQVQGHGQQLVISEFGDNADTVVVVNPADVASRRIIATIEHAPGYGVFPALAPDGRAIAYTALPSDVAKPSPGSPAVAAIVDVEDHVTVLANDVDLLIAPVWSPDSSAVVVRKNTPAPDSAGSFELILLRRDGTRSTITTWSTASVFPIAFAPDGSKLYYAALNTSGTDLYGVAPDGSAEARIAHLSDDIARDWQLSPDGATLAYSVSVPGDPPQIVTKTLDLATGAASDAIAAGGGARMELDPQWTGDGRVTVASVKPEGGSSAVSVDATGVTEAVTSSGDGIDLPLGWSPEGDRLAVRAVEGATPNEAGPSHVELVDADGGRQRVSENADVLIAGWLR